MGDGAFNVDYQRVLITMSLIKSVEDSDYTEKHSLRVGRLCKKVAIEMGYILTETKTLTRAAYFHDVGKIKLSKDILFKSGRLTDEEFDQMKQHPTYGSEILINLGLSEEAKIVIAHHERLDGSGYPNGISGQTIGLNSRILNVVDVFDAITSDRPYRKGLTVRNTMLYLYSNADTKFDLRVIKALHKVLESDRKIKKVFDQ